MNKDPIMGFLIGIVFGVVTLTTVVSLTDNVTTQGKKAIVECEALLPRDQHCKITAVAISEPTTP